VDRNTEFVSSLGGHRRADEGFTMYSIVEWFVAGLFLFLFRILHISHGRYVFFVGKSVFSVLRNLGRWLLPVLYSIMDYILTLAISKKDLIERRRERRRGHCSSSSM